MNRNYKVIWNRSLGCFTAVAEYAKSRGKSSSGAVTSNATPTSSVVGSAKFLRLSTLCVGLAAAGLSLQAIAVAPATDAFYVGVNSTADGTNYNGEGATGENAMAMGRNATATGSQAISIGSSQHGQNTTASGEQSIAIGANVVSSGNSSIAIGGDDLDAVSAETGVNSLFNTYTGGLVAVGDYNGNTESSGAASVAIGVKAQSKGKLSTAVGVRSSSLGDASSAFGMGASASKEGSLALGAGSIASEEGSVALGSFSKTDAVVSTTGITLNGSSYVFSGTSPTSTVSVGGGLKDGVMVTRTITNVAAGRISGASTDAINGSQLHATNLAIAANKTHFYSVKADPAKGLITSRGNYDNLGATGLDAMAAGIDAKAAGKEATAIGTNTNALGNFSTALGTQANATGAYNIALGAEATTSERLSTALGFQATASANNSMALGSKAKATAVKSIALGEGAEANHEGSVALGNFSVTRDVTLTTAYKPFADSVIAAPTAKSEVSVGRAGNERRITNLAAGAENTDAVNVSQLQAVQTGLTNVGFNITADNSDLVNSETEDTVKLGETVAYTSVDGSIVTTVADNEINFALGNNLNVGTSGIDGKDGFIGVNGKDGVSGVAINGADGTIGLTGPTGVSGTIGVIVGVPGVNGTNGITRIVIDDIQVATMEDGLKFAGNTGSTINKKLNDTLSIEGALASTADASGANLRVDSDNGKLNLVMAKSLTDIDSITINNDGPIISKNGIIMGRLIDGEFKNRITNLAPGVSPGDAVNMSQLTAAETHYYSVKDNNVVKDNYNNDGATGGNSMAAGIAAKSGGTFATAIGTEANAQGYASTALGLKAQATGVNSTALGREANATGDYSTALGWEASASADSSMALGRKAEAAGANNIALGREANTAGRNSTALGFKASASANNSMSLGTEAKATAAKSIALGEGANAAHEGSIALGASSVTDAAVATSDITLLGTKYDFAGIDPKSTVSVGSVGKERTITNVAAGRISSTSTDAINGSQLHATNLAIGDLSDSVVANKTHYYSVNDGGVQQDNYDNDGAIGNNSLAAGVKATATANRAVAMGNEASATGSESTALGSAAQAFADSATAVGFGARADQYGTTAMGTNSRAQGMYSTAVGTEAEATGYRAVAMGKNASATGSESTALGSAAQAFADSATAVGFGARADQYGTTAMGTNSRAQGMYSTAVGTEAEAKGYRAVAMGKGAIASDDNSVAMGAGSVTTAAVGTAGIMLNGSTYNFAGAVPKGTVSVGFVGKERTITNVAAGRISDISTDAINGSQLNATNLALGEITTTVGLGLDFAGNDGTVITKKMGDQLDIVGTLNASKTASAKNIRTVENDGKLEIQLADDLDVTSVTTGNTSMNNKGISILGGTLGNGNPVRLTKDGLFNGGNTIKGVGAGRVDATSNQAINGSQLFGTTTSIKTAIGGETVVNGDGTITTTNIGNTGKDNIHDAIESVRQEATDSRTTVSAGNSNITVTPTGPANGPTNYEVTIAEDLDITSIKTGNTVTNNDGVKVDDGAGNSTTMTTAGTTVTNTAGNTSSYGANGFIASDNAGNSTIVDQSGISFTNSAGATGPSITADGINAGGEVITGVANGILDDHAVNYGQLKGVKESAENANKGWNISAQGANTSTVKPSDTVNLENTDNNITVSKTADSNNVTFNLSKDIVVDSVKTGDSIINNDGLTIADGPKFTKTEVDAGGNKITNVANGFVEVASKDAVNGGQLFEVFALVQTQTVAIADMGAEMDAGLNFGADTGAAINKKLGDSALNFKGGNNITTTAVGSSIQFDLNGEISLDKVTTGNTSMSNSGVTIIGGPNQSVILNNEGLNNGGNKITNVADGMAPRDAVNFSQLDAVSRNLGNSINELGYKIGEVEDDANAGISAAMAMSSLPQSNIAGRSMIGGGIATYNGESAVAIGMSRVSDNGRWVIKVNGTADTQGNAGGAIGAGFHF